MSACRSAWYSSAVAWAESKGLVKGYPDGSFQPGAPITREQMATILQRYAQWKGLSASAVNKGIVNGFADAGSIAGWAKEAMQWAADSGIMKGDGYGLLRPQGSATRAEIAAMPMTFDNSRE